MLFVQKAYLQHQDNLPLKMKQLGIFYFLMLSLKAEVFLINFEMLLRFNPIGSSVPHSLWLTPPSPSGMKERVEGKKTK